MKQFNIQYNIGKSKYVINYHNGIKTHTDKSPFFDIAIFKNKVKLNKFVNGLINEGYSQK
jgi:hypothetical protein